MMRQLVAVLDGRVQVVEVADVLVVEKTLTNGRSWPLSNIRSAMAGELLDQVVERRLHGGAVTATSALPPRVLPHRRRNLDLDRHAISS